MLRATYALSILSRRTLRAEPRPINDVSKNEKENAMNKPVRQSHAPSRTAKAMSVADYIVERLAAEGISHCFGVAGDYLFPICDAVDSSAKMKWIGCACFRTRPALTA